jgi:hypothetical protein
LNLNKCCFGSKSITFLGHVVDNVISQPDPRKIVVVQHFPTPKTTTNVRAFLGLTWYYKRFIAGYAKIVEPFFALTKKDCKFLWTPICHSTFIALKKRLVEAPILVKPNFNKSFILDVDWSIRVSEPLCHKKLEHRNKSLLMPTRAYLQSSVIFIPWKESAMLSFGVSCTSGNIFTKPHFYCTQIINLWSG